MNLSEVLLVLFCFGLEFASLLQLAYMVNDLIWVNNLLFLILSS